MLREILTTDEGGRPRRILDALLTSQRRRQFVWRPTPDGLQVQIPAAGNLPQRRWSRLHPPEDVVDAEERHNTTTRNTEDDRGLRRPAAGVVLQATSAATEPSITEAAAAGALEWMQISCKPCSNHGPEASARAFVMGPTPLSMVVCTNRLQNDDDGARRRAELEEILTHEFLHVYDVRQLQLDLRDCENLAYSEIRAARQAECAGSWAPQACARVKAQVATQNLFPTMGKRCIKQVWEKAYKDTRPFGGTSNANATTTTESSNNASNDSSWRGNSPSYR